MDGMCSMLAKFTWILQHKLHDVSSSVTSITHNYFMHLISLNSTQNIIVKYLLLFTEWVGYIVIYRIFTFHYVSFILRKKYIKFVFQKFVKLNYSSSNVRNNVTTFNTTTNEWWPIHYSVVKERILILLRIVSAKRVHAYSAFLESSNCKNIPLILDAMAAYASGKQIFDLEIRAISEYYVYRNYSILTDNLSLEIPLEIPLDIEIPFSYRKYIYMQDNYDW